MIFDLAVNQEKGYFDISFNPKNGDILTTSGLDTAIYVSVLTDGRAASSEQPIALYRRGWFGDLFNSAPIGSKLWLTFSQPLGTLAKSQVIDEIQDALTWLITDGYADSITVTVSVEVGLGRINLNVNIFKDGIATSQQFDVLGNS